MSGENPVVSMIGSGSASAMLAARALLSGNGVDYRWIDSDTDPLGRLLAEHSRLALERPVALFADGSELPAPARFVDPHPAPTGRESADTPAAQERRVGMAVPAQHKAWIEVGAGLVALYLLAKLLAPKHPVPR